MTPEQIAAVRMALGALQKLGDASDKDVSHRKWTEAKGWEAIEALEGLLSGALMVQPAQQAARIPQPTEPATEEDLKVYRSIADNYFASCTKTVRYDLSPAMVEGEIRDKLIEMGWTPPVQGVKLPVEPLSNEVAKKLCKVGPIYAPDGKVSMTQMQFRTELEAAALHGLRKGEVAHGITGGAK